MTVVLLDQALREVLEVFDLIADRTSQADEGRSTADDAELLQGTRGQAATFGCLTGVAQDAHRHLANDVAGGPEHPAKPAARPMTLRWLMIDAMGARPSDGRGVEDAAAAEAADDAGEELRRIRELL